MNTPFSRPKPRLGHSMVLLSSRMITFITTLSTPGSERSFTSRMIRRLVWCGLLPMMTISLNAQNNPAPFIGTNLARGTQILELRLAVSCTGEYTQEVGGVANAQAYINSWLDEINEIYGREYCVRFQLIPNNDLLVFGDPATDPWPDKADGGGCLGSVPFQNDVQEQVINNIIGSSNYDFSHIFYSDDMAGGCGGSFHFGISGPPNVPITRHEMGHQFGQQHTVDNGGNDNYELQNGNWSIQGGNQHPYAHALSFHQLAVRALQAENANVGTKIPTDNTIPTVSAGPDRAIPVSTPFTLKGTAGDPNPGDQLTYVWDQLDGGIYQASPVADDSQGPLFMRFLPSTSPSRTIPKVTDLIAGNYSTTQEHLPTQARDMNIRLTVNDNHQYNLNGNLVNAGGINTDDLKLTVVNTGPFTVTAPNNGTEVWTTNTQVTVNWAVAGTNNAPISCAVVEIRLSADGGLTYPYLLADNTPNDGAETFLLPDGVVGSSQARIKVECDSYDNVRFFDISNQNFTITSSCAAFGGLIVPATSVSAPPGDPSLDLTLNPIFNNIPEMITFTVNESDPVGEFAELDGDNNLVCKEGFDLNYHTFQIQVDRTGSYTIMPKFVGGLYNGFFTLYAGEYDPLNSCINFVTSNTTGGSGGSGQTETIPNVMMTAGVTYTMLIQPWFQPSATCNVSFSSISGGKVFPAEGQSPPDGSYAYSYAAVNKATGIIAAVNSNADFTGLPAGRYEVYGFSYKASSPPPAVVDPAAFIGQSRDQVLIANCVSFSLNAVALEVQGGGAEPSCIDGIQNGDETGVDCGGSNCPACPTCIDGIQNGDETGVDCGGSNCPACPTCSDGIQNGDETGVDCGGSNCAACNTGCSTTTYPSTDTPVLIAEGPVGTYSSTINVPEAGSIADVNISLQGLHTYLSDLVVSLISPLGTRVTLFGALCEDMDDFNLTLDDQALNALSCPLNAGNTQQPAALLSAFNGENPSGAWVLEVMDAAEGDGGQLTSWSLQLCMAGEVNCNNPLAPPATGPIAAGTYLTQSLMTTAGQIDAPDQVTLISGTGIVLTSGFHVKPGASLRAYIEVCPPLLQDEQTALRSNEKAVLSSPLPGGKNQLSVYPNPFTAQTTLVYQLATSGRVAIEIYSLSGKRIAEFMQEAFHEPGTYELMLDMQPYPPGMYVVLLRTEHGVLSKRIASVK